MRSAKHVSINELKNQPRLGMADSFADLSNAFKGLHASGTVNELAKQIDTFAASLKGVIPTVDDITVLLSAEIHEFAALSSGVGRATAYFDEFAKATLKTIKNQSFLIESQKDLQKEFKMSSAGAFDFSKRLRGITVEIGDAKLFKYAAGLGKITGGFITSNKVSKETLGNLVKTQAFLQNNLGLSEEGAQSFELYAAGMGQSSEEALGKIHEMSNALAEFTGIDAVQQQSQIIQDITLMGADLQLQYGGVGNKLEVATMKARLLGTSMESLHGTGQSLLNIESSIGAEMEYQLLSGHRLLDNQGKSLTNEYRMATVTGNSTRQAELMNQFIDSEGDMLEHNLFARKKAAQLMGTDEASLAKMIQKRKLMTKLGAADIMNMTAEEAQTEIERLRKEAGGDKDKLKSIDDLIAASDTRTPAEQSADSLLSIKKDIARIAQESATITTKDKDGKDIKTEVTGAEFLKGLQTSIDASMDFAKAASDTFTDPNFIKGIGTLGIIGDRISEAITPINQMAKTLPGILSIGLTKLIKTIDGVTTKIIQPYTPTGDTIAEVPNATGGYISGAGTGTSDSIPARLSDGEYVINAASTRRNKALLDKINSGGPTGYAAGGAVTSNARMESLLSSILGALRGSNVMGETAMNGRKRI